MYATSDKVIQEASAEKVLQEATDKAWTDPKTMAAAILSGVNNQSTDSWADQVEDSLLSHTQTEVPDTTQGLPDEYMSGALTAEEVGDSLPTYKANPSVRLPSTLPKQPDLVTPLAPVPEGLETKPEEQSLIDMDESTSHAYDTPGAIESEASEVTSLSTNVRELTGVVDSFRRDMEIVLARIESRLSTVEAKVAQSAVPGIQSTHRRTLSPLSLAPPLPIIARTAAPTILPVLSQPAKLKPLNDELLARCAEYKYTPSRLAQKEILRTLAETKEIGNVQLPLSKTQWKPEVICQLVLSIRLANN